MHDRDVTVCTSHRGWEEPGRVTVGVIYRRVELPADMSSARAARRAVESGLGEDGFAGDVAGIVLLVSELVTNAVMHGQPPYAVVWELTDDMVRVSIEDGGTSRAPEIAATDPVDLKVGGNGLRFVEEFADTWGWDARNNGDGHPCGKTVWFTMDRSTR